MDAEALIVGMDGMVGSALHAAAVARGLSVVGTTRRVSTLARLGLRMGDSFFLDLSQPVPADLPRAEVAYLCAGVVGYKHCEGNPQAHRINVDGTLALMRRLVKAGSFIVFMSSDAAECMHGTAYGMHKALVEIYLQTLGPAAIVRAGRIEPAMLPALCDLLLDVGQRRSACIAHFTPRSLPSASATN